LSQPAGDVDYGVHGTGYNLRRRTDPEIAAHVHRALGPARRVLNVGAGAGSYEPAGRLVVAIEPSTSMIAQRPGSSAPVVRAVAGALPLGDDAVDASMATVTVHQWPDLTLGLQEMKRVTRGPVVILTFDGPALRTLWLAEYVPELYDVEESRLPGIEAVAGALGPDSVVLPVPVPFHCVDGFTEAFFGRPEAFLDPDVRASQSAWSFVDPEVEEEFVQRLADDLVSGEWDRRYGHLRRQDHFDGALRLVVG
jgi:SAM-dependent methyltransferase